MYAHYCKLYIMSYSCKLASTLKHIHLLIWFDTFCVPLDIQLLNAMLFCDIYPRFIMFIGENRIDVHCSMQKCLRKCCSYILYRLVWCNGEICTVHALLYTCIEIKIIIFLYHTCMQCLCKCARMVFWILAQFVLCRY